MNDRYFTERLFWLPDTNDLLHTFFQHGHGWYATEQVSAMWILSRKEPTYAELMRHYSHRDPQLLVQEVL